MFIVVVMVSNPGVNVSPLHTPTLALVFGSLALVVGCIAAAARPTPARPTGLSPGPSAMR